MVAVESESIYHIYFPATSRYQEIEWRSAKKSRVSFASMGAESLAASDSADRVGIMVHSLSRLFSAGTTLPLVFTVDSHGLYSTITTLHEGKDYRLRPVVERLRDSFGTEEFDVMQWNRGPKNISDALTKRNQDTCTKLNNVCSNGILSNSLFQDVASV